MNNLILFADIATKTRNKVLLWLVIILLFIIIVIGLISQAIKKSLSHRAEEIDLYVSDFCKAGILKSPKDVERYVKKRETRNLYIKNRWWMRIYLLIIIIFILIVSISQKYTFAGTDENAVFFIFRDLRIEGYWPKGQFFDFKNAIIDWYKITKHPIYHLNFLGISTYFVLLTTIIVFLRAVDQCALYAFKLRRSKRIKVRAFNKIIDTNKEN